MIPHPCLGVNRLADRAENTKGREFVLFHPLLTFAHQRTDCSRCGVEDTDAELVDDIPEPSGIRVGRHAFKHYARCSVAERTINNIAVACDPSDVRGAEMDVLRLAVEYPLERQVCIQHIAAGGMQHSFRLAGGAGRIKNEQRILGIHPLRLTIVRDVRVVHEVMPPEVALRLHVDINSPFYNDHVLDRRALFKRGVGIRFQPDKTSAADAAV